MKKLILIFWILIMVVWPVSVDATENQKIIFSGSYAVDNIATDADSAWLYMYYYATLVGSTTVTPEDLQWDGYYQHTHQCTNDSADGWSGVFIYFDNSATIQVNEIASIATARDSTIVQADMVKISGDPTAAENFETMLDGTGGQQLTLKRLSISGANGANASFYVSNSTGSAMILTTSHSGGGAGGLQISASAGDNYGLLFTGSGTGAGIIGVGGSSGGPGMWLIGGASGGHALSLLGNGAGDGIYSSGGAQGDGMHLLGQGAGIDFNATINLNDMSGDYDKDDFEDDFFETMSDTVRLRLDLLFTLTASLQAMIDGGNELVDLDTLKWIFAMIDSIRDSVENQAWWSTDPCAGAGAYTCTLTVVDTTHDATVSGVQVTVNNQAEDGTEYYVTSNSAGHAVLSLNNGDYRASAIGQPNVYVSTDFTIDGAVLHDSILGYSYIIAEPPSAEVATVYGYFITGGHDTLRNMDVTFEFEGYGTIIDTASNALVTAKIVRKRTNGNGKVQATLLKNENLITADGDSLVHPWWTCKADDPTFPFTIHFTIDNDSTTFNLGVESDAVQFRRR